MEDIREQDFQGDISPPGKKRDGTRAPRTKQMYWYNKLNSLPRVKEERERITFWCSKHINSFLGMMLHLAYSITCCIITSIAHALSPSLSKHVEPLDGYLTHQVEFIESKLTEVDTTPFYRPGGLFDRCHLSVCLFLRVTFFFPRMFVRITWLAVDGLATEVKENMDMLHQVMKPPVLRKSKRKTKPASPNLSPSKKRPFDATKDGHQKLIENLPDYFECVTKEEEYRENEDPDYEPESEVDTEVTSGSDDEGSDFEDNLENVEIPKCETPELLEVENPEEQPVVENL